MLLSRDKVNYFSYFGSTLFEYAYIYNYPAKLLLVESPDLSSLTPYGAKFYSDLESNGRVDFL